MIQRIVDALPGADNVGGSPTWPSGKSEADMVARLSGCAFRLKAVDGETRGRLVAVPAGATVHGQTKAVQVMPRIAGRLHQPVDWFDSHVSAFLPHVFFKGVDAGPEAANGAKHVVGGVETRLIPSDEAGELVVTVHRPASGERNQVDPERVLASLAGAVWLDWVPRTAPAVTGATDEAAVARIWASLGLTPGLKDSSGPGGADARTWVVEQFLELMGLQEGDWRSGDSLRALAAATASAAARPGSTGKVQAELMRALAASADGNGTPHPAPSALEGLVEALGAVFVSHVFVSCPQKVDLGAWGEFGARYQEAAAMGGSPPLAGVVLRGFIGKQRAAAAAPSAEVGRPHAVPGAPGAMADGAFATPLAGVGAALTAPTPEVLETRGAAWGRAAAARGEVDDGGEGADGVSTHTAAAQVREMQRTVSRLQRELEVARGSRPHAAADARDILARRDWRVSVSRGASPMEGRAPSPLDGGGGIRGRSPMEGRAPSPLGGTHRASSGRPTVSWEEPADDAEVDSDFGGAEVHGYATGERRFVGMFGPARPLGDGTIAALCQELGQDLGRGASTIYDLVVDLAEPTLGFRPVLSGLDDAAEVADLFQRVCEELDGNRHLGTRWVDLRDEWLEEGASTLTEARGRIVTFKNLVNSGRAATRAAGGKAKDLETRVSRKDLPYGSWLELGKAPEVGGARLGAASLTVIETLSTPQQILGHHAAGTEAIARQDIGKAMREVIADPEAGQASEAVFTSTTKVAGVEGELPIIPKFLAQATRAAQDSLSNAVGKWMGPELGMNTEAFAAREFIAQSVRTASITLEVVHATVKWMGGDPSPEQLAGVRPVQADGSIQVYGGRPGDMGNRYDVERGIGRLEKLLVRFWHGMVGRDTLQSRARRRAPGTSAGGAASAADPGLGTMAADGESDDTDTHPRAFGMLRGVRELYASGWAVDAVVGMVIFVCSKAAFDAYERRTRVGAPGLDWITHCEMFQDRRHRQAFELRTLVGEMSSVFGVTSPGPTQPGGLAGPSGGSPGGGPKHDEEGLTAWMRDHAEWLEATTSMTLATAKDRLKTGAIKDEEVKAARGKVMAWVRDRKEAKKGAKAKETKEAKAAKSPKGGTPATTATVLYQPAPQWPGATAPWHLAPTVPPPITPVPPLLGGPGQWAAPPGWPPATAGGGPPGGLGGPPQLAGRAKEDAAKQRVVALLASGGRITEMIDAVRLFEMDMATAGVRGCGWRALQRADHSECRGGRCFFCSGSSCTPYDAAQEGPIAASVKARCDATLQTRVLGA